MGRQKQAIKTATQRGFYRIMYAEEGRWHKTPVRDIRPIEEAIKWAERNRDKLLEASGATLSHYCARFFAADGAWAKREFTKGRTLGHMYLSTRQAYLDNYIVPLLGEYRPCDLTRRLIDDTILSAPAFHEGRKKPLAPSSKNKILYTLGLLLADLQDRGVIDSNPCEGIRPYSKAPVKPRTALPREYMDKLFPAGHGASVRVWGNAMWVSMMCLFADTGLRPGEARALRWAEIHVTKRFIAVRHSVASGTTNVVKSTKTGTVKPAYLSQRTIEALDIWRAESRYADDTDFVFTLTGKAPVTDEGIVKAFRKGLSRAGLDATAWTTYSLRHTFATYEMANLDKDEIALLLGHGNIFTQKMYQHPDDEVIYRQGLAVKEKLDKVRDSSNDHN